MTLNQRITAFVKLSEELSRNSTSLERKIQKSVQTNSWFTEESVKNAIEGIIYMLSENKLKKWTAAYNWPDEERIHKIGVIMAGNLPLVGFHDFLCVLISGNKIKAKLSSEDAILLPYLASILIEIAPAFSKRISFIERIEDIEAVIATGSDNTARYFDYYFGKYPNIIRKNRSSVAILTGKESKEELYQLGNDIFEYYGLGCRNISKVLVPKNYDFTPFFESIETFSKIINHHKYRNNYDYNKSIFLVNSISHLDNGFLLVTEDEQMVSPIAVLYYQTYETEEEALNLIQTNVEKIQCIVGKNKPHITFGKAQTPELWDYADNVDTLKFLLTL